MVLQESVEEGYKADYPTDDGSIHNLLLTNYEDVLGVKGASGVSTKTPQNFVAVLLPRPSIFVAAILRCPLLLRTCAGGCSLSRPAGAAALVTAKEPAI